jgi:multiple sugar transport system permease protein
MTATTLALPRRRVRADDDATVAAGERRFTPGRAVAYVSLVVLALLWLAPFLWAVITSFKSETDASATPVTIVPAGGFTTQRWEAIFAGGNVMMWMGNSVLVAIAVTAITLVVSVLAAYAFSRLDFPLKRVLFALTIASIMVPAQIFVIPLFDEMLALNLVDTYWGMILPQCISPVMIFVLKRFFDEIPRELEDAARVDGASRLRILLSVVLPLSRSIIAAVAIFVFIGAWNNFFWPFIVTNDPNLMTLPVGLQTVTPGYGVTYSLRMAQAVLAAAPLILVFVFFQRQIIRGISTTGIAGT